MKKHQQPILFATLGVPGSGKTTFSKKFADEFHIIHLNSDQIRHAITEKPKYTQKEHNAVFRVMDSFAQEALKRGKSVIYDANNTKRKYRKKLQQIARKEHAHYLLLYFNVPSEVALKRIQKRKTHIKKMKDAYRVPVSSKILEKIQKETEEPTTKEPTVIVDGRQSYFEQVERLYPILLADEKKKNKKK